MCIDMKKKIEEPAPVEEPIGHAWYGVSLYLEKQVSNTAKYTLSTHVLVAESKEEAILSAIKGVPHEFLDGYKLCFHSVIRTDIPVTEDDLKEADA